MYEGGAECHSLIMNLVKDTLPPYRDSKCRTDVGDGIYSTGILLAEFCYDDDIQICFKTYSDG